jgi:hypothetical protein
MKFIHAADIHLDSPLFVVRKIGTDTIIGTIRGVRGHDRACHGLLKPLHPAIRIM